MCRVGECIGQGGRLPQGCRPDLGSLGEPGGALQPHRGHRLSGHRGAEVQQLPQRDQGHEDPFSWSS